MTDKKPAEKKEKTPKCGLCGKSGNPLTKTQCCDNWICDDWSEYKMFSFAHNSCNRNHDRFTLCASHFAEAHKGDWRECKKCLNAFPTEMYVYYGTNEYNFDKLADPPQFEPTHCSGCGSVIDLGHDGYSILGNKYSCTKCAEKSLKARLKKRLNQ